VISRTEMGPLNAAAATALGIERFHPAVVINQGTAGGSNREVRMFDIIVGERTTDYSAFNSQHADAGTGTDPARWKPFAHPLRIGDEIVKFPNFPGDAALVEAALAAKNPRGRVLKGNIGSAFQLNRELDRIAWLHQTYGIDSEDMESAYAAGVAVGMKTRFVAIRMISDTEWEHPKFEPLAGEYCAQFVLELVRKAPKP
jgi:adenosylhomocysteine nucleosidase